jgi:beta-phosphoglucomutase-like phosphatase (HAD superfamily)
MLSDIVSRAEARLGRSLPSGFLERYERDRSGAVRARLQPVPGPAAAVRQIKDAGVSACVASQGRLSKTELTLRITGLRPLFPEDGLFSAYSVPRGKPFPDLFVMAADVMGADACDCVVVADSPSGVRAAVAAGMRVFGYAHDAEALELQDAGAQPLHSLEALPACLGLVKRS